MMPFMRTVVGLFQAPGFTPGFTPGSVPDRAETAVTKAGELARLRADDG